MNDAGWPSQVGYLDVRTLIERQFYWFCRANSPARVGPGGPLRQSSAGLGAFPALVLTANLQGPGQPQ